MQSKQKLKINYNCKKTVIIEIIASTKNYNDNVCESFQLFKNIFTHTQAFGLQNNNIGPHDRLANQRDKFRIPCVLSQANTLKVMDGRVYS